MVLVKCGYVSGDLRMLDEVLGVGEGEGAGGGGDGCEMHKLKAIVYFY